jgi:hypothetical protein
MNTLTVIGAIRTRYQLLIFSLEGEPRFQVILLRSCEIECARYDCDKTVGQSERLVELFRSGDHRIEHLPGLFRFSDAELRRAVMFIEE